MRYEVRPLGPWLDPITVDRAGSHRFRATWTDTLDLLARETELLGGDDVLVIVQVDVTDGDLRRDGMLRAGAKVGFPGVRVSFDSVHGPLTYATDAYERSYGWSTLDGWQANIRAIALALEALRAVDRYGVTRRGEQYRGWTQIEATPAKMTPRQAAEFIAHWAEPDQAVIRETAATALLRSPSLFLDQLYRRAAKRAHPDAPTGDHDTMARLNAARDLLTNGARRG